jgi:AmmeMemoRadiSam system protein A
MHLARQNGWKTRLLDYRNSGDTAGDRSGVVGYAAIAFYTDTPPKPAQSAAPKAAQEAAAPAVELKAGAPAQEQLAKKDKEFLLRLARQTLKAVVSKTPLPEPKPEGLAKGLTEPGACFVTLTKRGALRGCIGHLVAREPLYRSVMDNAQSAAIHDIRFPPVQPDEADKLEIEISVLTAPKPLAFTSPDDLLKKLVPHRDGVILQIGTARATYLPQVWEQLADKVTFLNSLSEKAGCEAAAWRKPGTAVQIYHVEAFKETEFK